MPVTESEIYQQQCEEFRALNGIFWQIPLIMTTLNGGLWFALASLDLTDLGQRAILIFAALVNVVFLIALVRLRILLGALLKQIHAVRALNAKGAGVTVFAFCFLLALAAIAAASAAVNPSAALDKSPSPTSLKVSCVGAASTGARTCTVELP